ncbi:MAG: hypothetical protein KY468_13295 [Armatimonadetes bacterium]|nr:hypothetical protein [Armatimonadota bacterium]
MTLFSNRSVFLPGRRQTALQLQQGILQPEHRLLALVLLVLAEALEFVREMLNGFR